MSGEHLSIGYKLNGRYKIIKLIGQGGFGIVYLVRDIKSSREYAIKELFIKVFSHRDRKNNVYNSNGSIEIFEKIKDDMKSEIDTLKTIKDNKNIVKAYGYFEENRTIYSIMEYIKGDNLDEVSQQFNENQVMNLLKQLINGLKELHSRNIIHRDIKPNNIIKTKYGVYKIIDFTNSKIYSQDEITITGIKTKGYTAPELELTKAKIGAYSDIYSIGMTIFKLISKKEPPSIVDRYKFDDRFQKDIESLPLNSDFISAIKKMTKIEPKDRFQNLKDIEDFLFRIDEPAYNKTITILIFSLIILASLNYKSLNNLISKDVNRIFTESKTLEFNSQNIEKFLIDFLRAKEGDSAENIAQFFTPTVKRFYRKYNLTRSEIAKIKEKWINRWRLRRFELLNFKITRVYSEGGVDYCDIKKQSKYNFGAKSGVITVFITLKKYKDNFKIEKIYY